MGISNVNIVERWEVVCDHIRANSVRFSALFLPKKTILQGVTGECCGCQTRFAAERRKATPSAPGIPLSSLLDLRKKSAVVNYHRSTS